MTKRLLAIMLLVLMSSQLAHAMQTYYEILGVQRTATTDQIKTAYRKLASQYHPDKTSKMSPADRLAAENKLKDITDAWDTLKDPQLKSAYDSNWNISDEAARRTRVAFAQREIARERQREAEAEFAAQAKKHAEPEAEKIRREKERAEREAEERAKREAAEKAKREAEERAREQERIRKEQERLRKEAEERAREQERIRREEERRRHEEAERAKHHGVHHEAAPNPSLSRHQQEAIERARAKQKAKVSSLFGE